MSEEGAADWQRMYDEITNPEKREAARQKAARAKRIADRRADTGL